MPFFNSSFSINYTLFREYYRWLDNLNNWRLKRRKRLLVKRHKAKTLISEVPNVYIHGYGYEWLYLSSLRQSFDFNLVNDPELADAIVFQSLVDEGLPLKDKDIYLFYGEPRVYSSLHFNKLPQDFFINNRVTVISHHPDPSYFLTPTGPFKFIRSVLYPPFLHGATEQDLALADGKKRRKKIFTITSALSGIAGNDNKKKCIEKFIDRDNGLDVFGRFSRAAFSVKNYRGACTYKFRLLGQYKFNLILENSPEEDWYITEKIYDSLLCGCMPIFHGSDKVRELLPSKWFYHLPSFDDDELDKLEEFMKTDAYLEVANNRKEIAKFIDENFSFYSAIGKVVNHQPLRYLI
jgi:hypothetical protein